MLFRGLTYPFISDGGGRKKRAPKHTESFTRKFNIDGSFIFPLPIFVFQEERQRIEIGLI
jgi:hypothetical protein